MSHYAVLVIGKNPEKQLEPFWKLDLSREEIMNDKRAVFKISFKADDLQKEFDKFKKEHKKEIVGVKEKYWKKYRTCSARKWIDSWSGEYLNKEKTHYGYYSNPNAKWNWFSIGGRWSGSLKLKKDSKGYLKQPTLFGICEEIEKDETQRYEENQKKNCVDSAMKKDIDFSPDKEKYKEAIRFWELKIEGKQPKSKKDKELLKFDLYNDKYYLEKFKTKKRYAQLQSEFNTYAVLKDGEWFESGEMGWFGCSGATPQEEGEFKENFYDKFIKDLPDETLLTIVDCHI